ncbi:sigma-54-dependent transcriptional regulator [Lichenicoccus sp.]|uniref:sigma-54-dependent transcriptional regulator n=1 Tax=Lichenicoccus sp. TaxID=2781899 RepID=UPI003D0E72AB
MSRVLVIDDDAALRESLAETIEDLGHDALQAGDGEAGLGLIAAGGVDAVLLDLRMPGLGGLEVLARIRARTPPVAVAVLTAHANAANTIEAIRLGAIDHLTKPVGREALAALLGRLLRAAPAAASPVAVPEAESLVGRSPQWREVQKAIGLLADSDASVLITGETGTGKEVVAQTIHAHGQRRRKPFVAVNCAAIPTELLESQLFGHVRGAFTGAVADRIGSFREADGGTLFLDEIGDMDLGMQAKLLRALQERVVLPVGGRPASIDVRILSATHRDLPALIAAGRFREDLFYRLGVVPLQLPALRERAADIPLLAEHFLQLADPAAPRRLGMAARERLLAHHWPGNVRELQNAMQRVTAMVRQRAVEAADVGFLGGSAAYDETEPGGDETLEQAVGRLETAMIRRALAASGGNRTEAARRLGIHRQLLHAKLRRYGLETG